MKNKNTNQEQVDANYYDAFIDSILSLPTDIRSFLLGLGAHAHKDNNPYLYLWQVYLEEELPENEQYLPFIHNILDKHNLAID